MKSVFKRFLLLGISLSIVVLVATQSWEQAEAEPGANDGGDGGAEPAPQPDLPQTVPAKPEHKTIPFKPLAGTTVTFSGKVIRAGSRYALRETAGILYTLDSEGRAWAFEGEDVRVTGQLDTTTRLLHIDDIQSMIA
ncbi:MAG: DUF5818 domain-containing protein [Acidobacteriota bacterium]